MTVPMYSVVIPAYNLARFLPAAIDSALAQQWPADRLEVIVVDDGSTDNTGEVLASYGERIRVHTRSNGGLCAAVADGLALVTGDYVGLLDADDEWPADRVKAHVEVLEARPEIGLVHSDMELIDETGATKHPSFFEAYSKDVREGRVLGALLAGNFVSGGAATFRASLLPAILPIHEQAAYPDWWIAAAVASVAEIATVPGIANRYRDHDSNMGLGTGDEGLLRALQREIPWRQWMLRNLATDPSVTAHELGTAITSWRFGLEHVRRNLNLSAEELYSPDAGARERSRELLTDAHAALKAGDGLGAAKLAACALGEDPWNGAALFDLDALLGHAGLSAAIEGPTITAAIGSPNRLKLAQAASVIGSPELLSEHAANERGKGSTLVLVLEDEQQAPRLLETVDGLGLSDDEQVDLLAITDPRTRPARALLEARADGQWLGDRPKDWKVAA